MTEAQYKALGAFFERYGEDDFTTERQDDDIWVKVYAGSTGLHFDRFIRPDGTIYRYDEDTDKDVDADTEPLKGTYNTDRTVHHYNY